MAELKLEGKEEANEKKFIKKQLKKRPYIDGDPTRFEYTLIPTGIGMGISIVDRVLKEEMDITDYDTW